MVRVSFTFSIHGRNPGMGPGIWQGDPFQEWGPAVTAVGFCGLWRTCRGAE
jgi:hypothetical protein